MLVKPVRAGVTAQARKAGNEIQFTFMNRNWKTETEIAEHFGIAKRSVRNLRKRRILPVTIIGRIVRYDLAACEEAWRKFQRTAL